MGRVKRDPIIRESTQEEIDALSEQQAAEPQVDTPEEAPPKKKGYLKLECSCGNVCKVSEQIIEDGLSWTMLYDNNHFLQLSCPSCKATLKIYLEEIKDELPQKSNTE